MFGRVGGKRQRSLVRAAGLLLMPEVAEQFGPHGVNRR